MNCLNKFFKKLLSIYYIETNDLKYRYQSLNQFTKRVKK